MTTTAFKPILLDLLHRAQHEQDTFLQELNESERAAIGTPDLWSAKDHVAHMTYWRQRAVLKLTAILRNETVLRAENSFEELNPQIFEAQRERPWTDILSESQQAYGTLIACVEQLSEEDLVSPHRFNWIPDGEPLYTVIMGNSYDHALSHYSQYFFEHNDAPKAIRIYESWTATVVQVDVPDALKGASLYNQACIYATHDRLEEASTILQQALTLYPLLTEFSRTDPDLDALRAQSTTTSEKHQASDK